MFFQCSRNSIAMKILGVAAGIFVLSLMAVNATLDTADEDHHLWNHELKKTFCGVIENTRIYKQEDLKIHCAGKVTIFDDLVRNFANYLSDEKISHALMLLLSHLDNCQLFVSAETFKAISLL